MSLHLYSQFLNYVWHSFNVFLNQKTTTAAEKKKKKDNDAKIKIAAFQEYSIMILISSKEIKIMNNKNNWMDVKPYRGTRKRFL